MKLRPFLAVVLAVALLLLSLAAGGWWLLLRQSPLALQSHSLRVPLASRFISSNAPLSVHLQVNPDQAVAYARAVAPPRLRRQAAAVLERLRDGAFAAVGLDYPGELAGWLGNDLSLALLEPPSEGSPPGWVLALASRDPQGARSFLQRFWQTRSLAGTDLQISSYRGMGLISGRGALLGQRPQPLATALIDDDLVLIASGRMVLEQALDVSQIEALNQAGSGAFRAAIEHLGQGVALITARPGALPFDLGLAAAGASVSPPQGLVASLAPSGSGVVLEASLGGEGSLAPAAGTLGLPLLTALRGNPASLLLLADGADLLENGDGEAPGGNALVASGLRQALASLAGGPLPALLAQQTAGPLLLATQPGGWLIGTAPDQPLPSDLQPALASAGFLEAPLEVDGHDLTVWTQLQAKPIKGDPDQLRASLAGARGVEAGLAWWGEGLAVLQEQWQGHSPARARLAQLEALGAPQAPIQWALAPVPARALLGRWQPWQLLGGLASAPLTERVQGLALGLEGSPGAAAGASAGTPERSETGGLRLKARLELA
ncbi:DUF3352 domain-containing protein [Cyanobium sp. Morenito 9A2]|uniref:DUF3352 domain-containing protein n=1 Tax=Cyanobium sp. Morenito 9A2 TaxID=2823718 RepID=UPI0020CE6675|nr:DUF3352 domain-containing protein [Cyanobium sp. Morenito 9A2]MCP9849945.1 DUF3352 domain-containing protein [Cyanobium sp. Morenito 9A2]